MLASLEQIHSLAPIGGADRIECGKVLSWPVVVEKSKYKNGDEVVFIQPDTTVPRAPWNQFLWPKKDLDPNGGRIRLRCCKFKGQPSMGLVVSPQFLSRKFEIGEDVSEDLGIEKWEMPLDLGNGQTKGNFPAWLRKSDEHNVLSCPRAFYEIQRRSCSITVKMDGSSAKFSLKDGAFQVFSRRLETVHDGGNSWSFAATKYNLESKLRELGRNLALCGELCGPKLNGNKMGLKEPEFYLYDVWDIDNQVYLDYHLVEILSEQLEIPSVPLWKPVDVFRYESIVELQTEIDKCKYRNEEWIEGVVVRPIYETYSPALKGRLSWKLINTNFAAKHL